MGEGARGGGTADETTGWLRRDISSVDEASRMTVWRTVTNEATAKRGSVSRCFRRATERPLWSSPPEKSVRRTIVGDVVANEVTGREGSRTGDRRRKLGHRTAAGGVAPVNKASSAEGMGTGTCRRGSQGRLWASRCGQGRWRGGRAQPGLPPQMRPQDGRGCRFARWMWSRRKAERMLLRMLLRPDGFRGCLQWTRL